MEETIKIPKRLYDDIKQYCSANNTDVEKYCISVLRKQIALDKYGDLNEKLKVPKESEEKKPEFPPVVVEIEPKKVEQPEAFTKDETKVEIPIEIKEPEEKSKPHRTIKVK